MVNLIDFLLSLHPLPDLLTEHLRGVIKEREFSRKDYLLKAGKICDNIYFVRTGLLRRWYFNGMIDISSGFMKEGDICLSIESFFSRQPGNENIQALEDSVIQSISYVKLNEFYREFPILNFAGRLLAQIQAVEQDVRIKAMWMRKASHRYAWLQKNFPELSQRVPAKYLASFLGITNVMYSRLRAKT